MAEKKNPAKILIVDDLSVNVKILENIIQAEGHEALCALNVQRALDIMNQTMPQLILSDYSMPGMNGLEFCKLLKSNPRTRDIPFIFITVANSGEDKRAAFEAGAVDFIPKPFERIEVVMRVNNHLNSYRIRQEMEDYNRMMHRMVEEQKRQVQEEQERVLLALAKIVERRNANVDNHLEKVGYNCHLLAQSLQLVPKYEEMITDEFVDTIATASILHDIGDILIADDTIYPQENGSISMEEIRMHTEEGAKILEEINGGGHKSPALDMAILIARYHHANWDGSGYPEGLSGTDIPLEARITAVANDFDAFLGHRHGGVGHTAEESIKMINEKSGVVYDPHIVEVFNKIHKQLRLV
ncbi:MAG: response regulator [bacterium]|nr:response regulator [bacterium]